MQYHQHMTMSDGRERNPIHPSAAHWSSPIFQSLASHAKKGEASEGRRQPRIHFLQFNKHETANERALRYAKSENASLSRCQSKLNKFIFVFRSEARWSFFWRKRFSGKCARTQCHDTARRNAVCIKLDNNWDKLFGVEKLLTKAFPLLTRNCTTFDSSPTRRTVKSSRNYDEMKWKTVERHARSSRDV